MTRPSTFAPESRARAIDLGPQRAARSPGADNDDSKRRQTVQVWDLTQRDRPVPLGPALEGHEKAVNSVAIGPNGIMATASEDETAVLWDLSGLEAIRSDPVANACLRTGQGLNKARGTAKFPPIRKLALAERRPWCGSSGQRCYDVGSSTTAVMSRNGLLKLSA